MHAEDSEQLDCGTFKFWIVVSKVVLECKCCMFLNLVVDLLIELTVRKYLLFTNMNMLALTR